MSDQHPRDTFLEDLKKLKMEVGKIRITKIIILRETLHESILSDLFTFICIALLASFNHVYLGGGWALDLFVVFAVTVFIVGYKRKSNNEMTVDEAINYLMEIKKNAGNTEQT